MLGTRFCGGVSSMGREADSSRCALRMTGVEIWVESQILRLRLSGSTKQKQVSRLRIANARCDARNDAGGEGCGQRQILRSFAMLKMTARNKQWQNRCRFLGSASLTRCNARNDVDFDGERLGGVHEATLEMTSIEGVGREADSSPDHPDEQVRSPGTPVAAQNDRVWKIEVESRDLWRDGLGEILRALRSE